MENLRSKGLQIQTVKETDGISFICVMDFQVEEIVLVWGS